jgi:hypothetical protein
VAIKFATLKLPQICGKTNVVILNATIVLPHPFLIITLERRNQL